MTGRETLAITLDERRNLVPPGRDPAVRAQRRQRMVHALRGHLGVAQRRRQRLRIWRRVGLGTLPALIAAGGFLAWLRLQPGQPSGIAVGVLEGGLVLHRPGGGRGLVPGEEVVIEPGDSLETGPDRGAQVRLAGVASLTLSPDTRVSRIGARDGRVDRLRLARGRAHLWVRKLAPGQRFHVFTRDAEMEVLGTEFEVDLGRAASSRTCVRVQEGRVLVVAGPTRQSLQAGQSWGCEPPAAATSTPAPSSSPSSSPGPRKARPGPASDLKAQNALFQQALAAERAGRDAVAVRLYRRLLARYPDGPLSAQARASLAALRASP